MNVLITAPNLNVNRNVSGISSVVGTIIQNNKETNYHHFVAGREDGENSVVKRITGLAKGYVSLVRILQQKDIDLVHLNLPLNPKSIYRDYLFFVVSKMFRKKVLLHLHGGKFLLEKPADKILNSLISRMYKGSELVVCLSQMEKEIIEQAYSLNDVKVLENTVDDLYLKLTKPQEEDSVLTVLFLGRLHESKGVHIIIASIKELMAKGYSQLRFVFCGMGPLLNEVNAIANEYPGNVSYMGIVGGEAKNEMLAAAQVFILPSLYGEGLPMSLIEAMAAGLVPVVTTDGSMKAIIQHGANGFFVDKNNPSALTKQLEELVNHRELVTTVAQNAKVFVEKRFSIKKYISSLNEFYKSSVASVA